MNTMIQISIRGILIFLLVLMFNVNVLYAQQGNAFQNMKTPIASGSVISSSISYSPDTLVGYLWPGTMLVVPGTLINGGTSTLLYEFPDYTDFHGNPALAYCPATAVNCDEYIGNVSIGTINHSSACEHYGDFTAFSTDIDLSFYTTINVTNGGNAYSADMVYVWIDYDHNGLFDADELTTLNTLGGGTNFSGGITVPMTALPGITTMRVRMSYNTGATPCGTQTYGEVEDYSVNLRIPSFIINVLPAAGTIAPGQSYQFSTHFTATGPLYSNPGVYYSSLKVASNDPVNPVIYIPAKMIVTLPGFLEGFITDATTGEPLFSASITPQSSAISSYSNDSGYYSLNLGQGIPYSILFSKTGYRDTIINVILPNGNPMNLDVALYPEAYPPSCASSATDPNDTECTISWCAPIGEIELSYDDGGAENYISWVSAGNMNAVKFSTQGLPARIIGGSIYSGEGSYPPGGYFIGQQFGIAVYDDDGAGGLPGTMLDSVWVTATTTGWLTFGGLNAEVEAGDFYLAMIQGSNAPDCVPLGVDITLPKAYRSYSRNVGQGQGWVLSPYQDLMIRAIITAPLGDKKVPVPGALKRIPQRVQGMISALPEQASSGIEITEPLMRSVSSQSNVNHYALYRITGFDPQIGLQTGIFTLVDSAINATIYTENGVTWQNVPAGWVAYGIKARYPSGLESDFTFTNAVPHKIFASLSLDVHLICTMAAAVGAEVTLSGSEYPYETYTAVVPANGIVTFERMIEGHYLLQVTYPGYSLYSADLNIAGSSSQLVILEDLKYVPRNLQVNEQTLIATWEQPLSIVLDENFETDIFPPPGWQNVYQGSVGWFATNAGSFGYFLIPAHSWYAMVNDGDAGNNNNGCCDRLITPCLNLTNATNYQLIFDSYYMGDYGYTASVEISFDNCQTWSTIYPLTPSFAWRTLTVDLSSISGINGVDSVWFAFHGDDLGVWSTGWCVDNVRVVSGSIPYLGYGVFIDGSFVGQTQQTTWTFNPDDLNYGQQYIVGVAGKYCSGYSEQDTALIHARYLPPPRNFAVEPVEDAALLTWSPPLIGDYRVLGSIPRTEYPDESAEYCNLSTSRSNGDQPSLMWDILFVFNATTGAQAAVGTDGYFIYTADWNGTGLHKYALDGSLVEDFTVQGAGEIRDFTFHDGLFYGTTNSGDILILDLLNHYLVGTISTGLSNLRHIAFDPGLDGNNGGFWVGAWSTEYQVRMDGSLIGQVNTFNLSSCYGSAYDGDTYGGPFMWYADQGGNGVDLYQFSIPSMQFTGFVQDATTIPGYMTGSVAGGLEYGQNLFPMRNTLIGSIQQSPNLLYVYDMSECACGNHTLTGYRVYRDDSLISQVALTEEEYWDMMLDPGTYCYEISAVHDLTSYGFPGEYGESARIGPECADIIYGNTLPFTEDWSSGQFSLNHWAAGENWSIEGQVGNPAPSAKFSWEPFLSNYSSALESYWINSSNLNPEIFHEIWLDYDLKLEDQASSGNEFLAAEVWDGENWVEVESCPSTGSFDWTRHHLNITSLAEDKAFKIRFRAFGTSTTDIHYWYVDSIQVYCKYFLHPPAQLHADLGSGYSIVVSWQPPSQSLSDLVLDDSSYEIGLYTNGQSNSWFGNEFNVTDPGILKFALIRMETNNGNAVYNFDIFNQDRQLVGSSAPFVPVFGEWTQVPLPDVSYQGKFYLMLHIISSEESDVLTIDNNGPNAPDDLEWYYNGSQWEKLSLGGWDKSVFLIRAKALTADKKSGTLQEVLAEGPKSIDKETSRDEIMTSRVSSSHWKKISIQGTADAGADNPESTENGILGYHLYRKEMIVTPTGWSFSDWHLIASPDTTVYTDHVDFPDCYYYQVTALFAEDESGPSNEDFECIPTDVKDLDPLGMKVYPNPVSKYLFLESSVSLEAAKISMYSGQGQLLKTGKLLSGNCLDVQDLADGLYILEISADMGTGYFKFVVAH